MKYTEYKKQMIQMIQKLYFEILQELLHENDATKKATYILHTEYEYPIALIAEALNLTYQAAHKRIMRYQNK